MSNSALTFDVSSTPFSRFGSYLSIMRRSGPPALGQGLYLRLHRARGVGLRDAVLIEPLIDGQVCRATATGRPDVLTLDAGGGRSIEICFADDQSLRIRGRGMGLRFRTEPGTTVVAQPVENGRWSVNVRPALCRFMFDAMQGQICVDAPWRPNHCEHVVLDLLPEAGQLDAAIDAYQSTWVPRRRDAFDAAVAAARRDFASWLESTPPAPADLRRAWEHAAYVNWSAAVYPLGFVRRPAVLMSKVVMDQIWSWDNCFNAMALCYGQPQLAWDQLLVVADHQDEFGAFPDGLNPSFRHYNFCKPPVMGWALDFMLQRRPDLVTPRRLLEIYEPLCRWSRWWLAHRTAGDAPLPYYLHGNDSGWDNSTMFDAGAPLVAPDLAAILSTQLAVAGKIAGLLGKQREAAHWHSLSQAMLDALVGQLWRGDRFVARRLADGADVDCDSLVPLVPLVLGRRLPEPVADALVQRLPKFLTPHGLATELPSSPHYTPDGYWRGPIWAPPTLLIVDGLNQLGRRDLARDIARRFCSTCAAGGFAENFDALTGQPLRDTAYTWTSSVFLILAHEYLR